MSDLQDLLGSMAAGPDPVMVPASEVRARGDRRRRRARALVAAAATVAVALGAGTAVALAGGGRPDALVPVDRTPVVTVTPTQQPTREPTPTASAAPDEALSADDPLQQDRIGPVVVGMTLDEARGAAAQELRQEGDDLGGCVYYTPRSQDPDVFFMVIRGVVSRVDVDSGTTTTAEGIGIGATEDEVSSVYPTAVVSKHYYTDGHYLRVLSEDGRHAYLFETDGTKVLRFRSGFADAVDQVEGCA